MNATRKGIKRRDPSKVGRGKRKKPDGLDPPPRRPQQHLACPYGHRLSAGRRVDQLALGGRRLEEQLRGASLFGRLGRPPNLWLVHAGMVADRPRYEISKNFPDFVPQLFTGYPITLY